MRRAAVLLCATALTASGCGGEDEPVAPRATPGAAAPASSAGLTAWVSEGCGSCHTLAAGGSTSDVGPALEESLKGKSRAYVIESIVAPGAARPAGFSTGLMPEDYAQRLSRTQIDALADFLLEAAKG